MSGAPTTTEPSTRGPAARGAAIRIVPQTEAEMAAVRAFNARMLAGHAPTDFVLPDRPNEPGGDAAAIAWTKYVAIDGDNEVRGGFLLMRQRGWLNGDGVAVANYQAPVSEGILDKRYGMVGMHMLRYLEREWPLSFVVGMGGADRPLPRLLAAAGWTVVPVPFLFRIVRAGRVLRELQPVRGRPAIRAAANLAAASGAGWIGARLLHSRGWLLRGAPLEISRVHEWGEWSDRLWERMRGAWSFCVARDRETLESLYPLGDERYTAYCFRRRGSIAGWAVCAQAQMRDHAYFGNLRVATVLDALAEPEVAASVAASLWRTLSPWADLIVTNQSHALWVDAFRRAGFASAPSNYLLALSRALGAAVGGSIERVHVTRGDGDGRIHLI